MKFAGGRPENLRYVPVRDGGAISPAGDEEPVEAERRPDRVTGGASMPFEHLREEPASGTMDAMATVLPDWTRQDEPSLPPDRHTPHVDVDNVLLGADTNSLRRANADWANPRVRPCAQALEHDTIAAPRTPHPAPRTPHPATSTASTTTSPTNERQRVTWTNVHPHRTVRLDIFST
jgi:hypothetical protein